MHRLGVNGAVINALAVSSEDDERLHHEAPERVAGVGKSESVTDACAVHFLPFDQSIEEAGCFVGASLEAWDQLHKFLKDRIAVRGCEIELDCLGIHAGTDGELGGRGRGRHGVV